MANLIEWCMLMLAAPIFRMFWLLLFWYKSKNMFCSYMFLERSPVTNLHEVPRLRQRDIQSPCCEHALWWWEYEHISDKSPLTVVCQSFYGRSGWREFVVNRNVLATAWITLLTPEEADNLSAAQQGRLNVTRQPNHLLMKAWQRPAEPPCRARSGEQKPSKQIWAPVRSLHEISPSTRAQRLGWVG